MRVLFVCLGNICRSPMAEFVFKDLVDKNGMKDKFIISSAATYGGTERNKESIHIGTRRQLEKHNIPYYNKYAKQLRKEEYDSYDYILAMEKDNINDIMYIIKDDPNHKVYRLLDFTNNPRDISDPWYTGNFDETYSDVYEGCLAFFEYIKKIYQW